MIKLIKKSIKARFPKLYTHYLNYQSETIQEKQYFNDLQEFKEISKSKALRFSSVFDYYPIMDDKTSNTPFEPHYTYHPAWAARILAKTKPKKHIDISSTLNFCTLVSAFIPVDFYDYRPAKVMLSDLNSKHADLTQLFFKDDSILSLSCMHTIEHVGLGRYGDPLDYDGDLKAISELKRVLAINGDLLFVVPIGKPKIAYNAHRIYSYDQILNYFSGLELQEFSLVPDDFENIGLIKNASAEISNQQNWGCGCFWFKKSKA